MPKSCRCILLVGSGQLGARYLQGIAQVELQLIVFVVDSSLDALEFARQCLSDVNQSASVDFRFGTSLEQIPHEVDLAIVATPAHCRADVVAAIASRYIVKSWILEKLLAQSVHHIDKILDSLNGVENVWVNTPRRLMALHKSLKQHLLIGGEDALRVRMIGGSWGLACNAIHFIDLVSWFTGSKVDFIDSRGLEDWYPSKRPGFKDVFGTINVHYLKGERLELICNRTETKPTIEIEVQDGIWLLKENEGKAVGPFGIEIAGELSFQSTLTGPLVNNILINGHCDLPSLVDSAAQHRPLLDALLKHWNESQGVQDLVVPVT